MHHTLRRTLPLMFLISGTGVALAQTLPTAQPSMLNIVREEVKVGRAADHAKIEAGWPAAYEKAKSPNYYLAMVSMTGPAEAWYITPFESHAAQRLCRGHFLIGLPRIRILCKSRGDKGGFHASWANAVHAHPILGMVQSHGLGHSHQPTHRRRPEPHGLGNAHPRGSGRRRTAAAGRQVGQVCDLIRRSSGFRFRIGGTANILMVRSQT